MSPRFNTFAFTQATARKSWTQRLRPWRLPRRWNPGRPSRRRPRRSVHRSPSTVPRPWRRRGTPSILASVRRRGISWTTTRSSSIPWPPSLPWRRSRTTTPWFSSSTSAPTRRRSRMPWRRCTTFRPRKSTLWSGNVVCVEMLCRQMPIFFALVLNVLFLYAGPMAQRRHMLG